MANLQRWARGLSTSTSAGPTASESCFWNMSGRSI